jgi:sec-independent protein translocase protein TatA
MFDPSAPHIIILLIVVLLLFGSRRLPGAAKSLGESMHIFKKSVTGNSDEEKAAEAAQQAAAQQAAAQATQQQYVPQTALPPAAPQPTHEQQLADMQRQLAELQKQNAGPDGTNGAGAPLSEAQRGQQPF